MEVGKSKGWSKLHKKDKERTKRRDREEERNLGRCKHMGLED